MEWAAEQGIETALVPAGDDATLDRAVVGYLLVSPRPDAAAALKRLHEASSQRVDEARRYLSLVGVGGSS